ncbi:universal stress protein [Microvirga alba]|uniref:Universal stress protein n=1 Tax=Microvirga alba TaxID=2791025 RepID=A0A931FPQ2_9HYPH|nr:universal stress protein [Microvirga alba]MBF9232658.1 universal stress protein [Microvirga alba]
MIKDVLVHLDGTADDDWRISHMEPIARAFEAHVTGLFLNRMVPGAMPIEAGYVGAQLLEKLLDQARDEGDRIQKSLAERLSRLNLPYEIRRIDAFSDEIPEAGALEARGADICIVLRPYTRDGAQRWLGLVEGVLFGSGRGILIVPEKKPVRHAVEHVVIAWNASREAAHALAEAMPLLKKAREVTAVLVDPEIVEAEEHPSARLLRHLEHHGVKANICVLRTNGERVSEILIKEAEKTDADLMVTGGYGHARIREWVLGGVTRELLHLSPIPLLLAH